jgi:hypothetical protein
MTLPFIYFVNNGWKGILECNIYDSVFPLSWSRKIRGWTESCLSRSIFSFRRVLEFFCDVVGLTEFHNVNITIQMNKIFVISWICSVFILLNLLTLATISVHKKDPHVAKLIINDFSAICCTKYELHPYAHIIKFTSWIKNNLLGLSPTT